MTPTIEVLRRARDLVARLGGWCQGRPVDEMGRCCAVGAVAIANDEGRCFFTAKAALIDELRERMGSDGYHIPTWNDAPGRTQDEVIDLFNRAIARLEAEERGR